MYKVKWAFRTISALHYLVLEYNDSRHIFDATATQIAEWKKDGYIRIAADRFITWNALQETSYFRVEEHL